MNRSDFKLVLPFTIVAYAFNMAFQGIVYLTSTPTQVWLTFIATISTTMITAILTVVVAWMGMRQKQSNLRQERSYKRQEQNIVEVRTFTNSAMGMALKMVAASDRRVADITGLPADAKIAEMSAAVSAQHEAAQKVVDAQVAARPVEQQ